MKTKPKACISCIHFVRGYLFPQCGHRDMRRFDMIYGATMPPCERVRASGEKCGPEGLLHDEAPDFGTTIWRALSKVLRIERREAA